MCDNCAEARRLANQVAESMSSADKSREFYRRQGECRERERIIKLLEPQIDEIGCCSCGMKQVIALIKEENK